MPWKWSSMKWGSLKRCKNRYKYLRSLKNGDVLNTTSKDIIIDDKNAPDEEDVLKAQYATNLDADGDEHEDVDDSKQNSSEK